MEKKWWQTCFKLESIKIRLAVSTGLKQTWQLLSQDVVLKQGDRRGPGNRYLSYILQQNKQILSPVQEPCSRIQRESMNNGSVE